MIFSGIMGPISVEAKLILKKNQINLLSAIL